MEQMINSRYKWEDVWVEGFYEFYQDFGSFNMNGVDMSGLRMIFNLLEMTYWGQTIAYKQPYAFKLRLFRLINTYGKEFMEKTKLQDMIKELDFTDFNDNGRIWTNRAMNPNTEPAMTEFEALPYVNEQVGQKFLKGKTFGLIAKWGTMNSIYVEEFLSQFEDLFMKLITKTERRFWKWT